MASVEYEVVLRNGQFVAAAKQSEQAIRDVGKDTTATGASSMGLREQLRMVREELVAMEMAGKRGSDAYRELQERAGKIQDAVSDASAQMRIMAHDQRGMQGIISGLTGLSGAMSAAAGVVGLFGEKNEELQKIMLKVQSLMAITVGLQQLQAALDKDSAFRLVTLNALKEWWAAVVAKSAAAESVETETLAANTVAETANAAATTAAGTAATASAGAFTILGTAIKSIPGVGWILVGISAVIAAASFVIKNHKQNAAEEKRLIDEEIRKRDELRKAIADQAGGNVAKVAELSAAYKSLGENMQDKKRFISEHADEFSKLGLQIDTVSKAESLLVKNTDAFVKSEVLKAKASAIRAKAAKIVKDNIDVLSGDYSPNKPNVPLVQGGSKYQLPGSTGVDYMKLGLEKQLEGLYRMAADFESQASSLMSDFTLGKTMQKATGVGSSNEGSSEKDLDDFIIGYRANLDKLIGDMKSEFDKARNMLGKTMVINGQEITFDEDAVSDEIEVIRERYKKLLDQLKEKYGINDEDEGGSEEVVEMKQDVDSVIGQMTSGLESMGKVLKSVVIARLRELVRFVKDNKGNLSVATDENASKFGISTESLKTLLESGDALGKLEEHLDSIDKSDAIKNLADAIKKLKKASEDYKNSGDLINEDNLAKAKDTMIETANELNGAILGSVSDLSKALREIASITGNESLIEAADYIDDILGNFQAAERGAEAWGGWWGAIIGGIVDLIPKIVKLSSAERDLNKALSETSKEINLIDKKIQLLKVGGLTWGEYFQTDWEYAEKIKELEDTLAGYEANNKKGKYDAEIAATKLEIEQVKQERLDMMREFAEEMTGLTSSNVFSELSDTIWDAFTTGQQAMDNFEQSFNEMMVNVVKKQLLWKLLGEEIEKFVDDIGRSSIYNKVGPGGIIDIYRQRWDDMVSRGLDALNFYKDIFGDLGALNGGANSLSGSIQSITSEQAGMLAGQMNAMRMSQNEHTSILTDSLLALNSIEQNTRYIRRIYDYIQVNNNNNLNRAYGNNNL